MKHAQPQGLLILINHHVIIHFNRSPHDNILAYTHHGYPCTHTQVISTIESQYKQHGFECETAEKQTVYLVLKQHGSRAPRPRRIVPGQGA